MSNWLPLAAWRGLLRTYWVIGVVIVLATTAYAEPSQQTAHFRSLTDVDGLSQMSASALAQDAEGYLWIGTQVGLNRYDGAKFRTFDRQSGASRALSEFDVSALLSARDGSLWVGTLNGLYRFDPATELVLPFLPPGGDQAGIAHQRINALIYDRDGVLWIASDGGLARYAAATGEFASYGAGLAERRVHALAADGQGGLWLGMANGLWHFDPAQQDFRPVLASGAASGALRGWIQALCVDHLGALWIGSKDAGLLRLSKEQTLTQWRHDPADPHSLSHDRIYALLEDRSGRLWIGTEAGADLLPQPADAAARFVRFQHRAAQLGSIGAGRIVSLMQDKAGDLWFGTWSGGASLLSPMRSQFLSFSADTVDPLGLDAAEVVTMLSFAADQIWLGTRRGLFLFDASKYQLQAIVATSGLRVYAVAQDADTLLLGTDQGIYRFAPESQTLQRLSLPASVGQPYVDFIIVEADRILVSSRDADLFVLDRALSTVLAHHRLDSRAHFMTQFTAELKILGGDKGLYWFSSDGLRLEHRLRADPDNPQGLRTDTCHSFLRAADGQLWLATAAGLHRMEIADPSRPAEASFRVFRNGDGANTNAIKSLIEDGEGRLWMSSNAGIARFDPKFSLFRTYGAADGAIDRGYYAFVYTQTAAGHFAFGGASGFTVFDPTAIVDLQTPPSPLLTELELDNRLVELRPNDADALLTQPLQRTTKLRIPAGRARTIGLSFAAPYFVAPEHLRFAYRLDGFSAQWIETDATRRHASYTNLAPGTYQFQVRVRTADADWSDRQTQLTLVIEPFWWQTHWAKAVALLALIGFVWAFFVARLRWLARQQRRLSEKVAYALAQSDEAMAKMHNAHHALAEAYGRIEHLSRTDALTGLGNRRSLDLHLPALLTKVEQDTHGDAGHCRLGFFVIDVDRFKSINDSHGHSVGDRVLSELGQRLKTVFPEPGLIVRWGGEEFLAFTPVGDEYEALQIGEALRLAVAQSEISGGTQNLACRISIGFACYPFDASAPRRLDWERVVEIADAALYVAKNEGRNRVVGFRCIAPIDSDFEARLRRGPQELCQAGVMQQLDSSALGTG